MKRSTKGQAEEKHIRQRILETCIANEEAENSCALPWKLPPKNKMTPKNLP
ncbi:Hypothetical protein FKW44_004986 [Caligus rogercresseyi]|uniref:Uncharacterized protein n=1 Tax=Caligus rogercresseyi TaxID=217165 RepID=A0A7T8HMD8_CALRO|nr:Hypothetical protein FKW44_004986 [Caligus rogercresseyi]